MFTRVALPTVVALLSIAAAGCQMSKKPAPTIDPPATDAAYQQIKAEFATAAPMTKVGYVSEVRTDSPWLAVSMIDVANFPVGTVISIVDAEKKTTGFGTVREVADGEVYVMFEKAGSRGPKVGDVALKF